MFYVRAWQQGFGQRPELPIGLRRAGDAVNAKTAGQYALDVAIENCRALAKSKGGNGRSRRTADSGQLDDFFCGFWKAAAMIGDQRLRTAVQVARSCVVTESGPEFEYGFDGRLCQRRDIGETVEEAGIVRYDCTDLRLLQHDLGKPDAIRVAGALPGQVVTTVRLLPLDQAGGEVSHDASDKYWQASRQPNAVRP